MLLVKRLDQRATLPTVAHAGEDLAYDLYALEDVMIKPGNVFPVRTGIAVQHSRNQRVPGDGLYSADYETFNDGLLIRDRSSMASKGIFTTGGVVDAGYRGEIIVLMSRQWGYFPYKIEAGNKIAQMIPIPVLTGRVQEVDELSEAARGEKGFGSSGR